MNATTYFKRSFIGSFIAATIFTFIGAYRLAAFGETQSHAYFRIAVTSLAIGTLMLIMYLVKKRQGAKYLSRDEGFKRPL